MTAARADVGGEAGYALSVVVICFNMRRELARTLRSLSGGYQRGVAPGAYEVILVDNGSDEPPTAAEFADLDLNLRIVHQPNPRPSPVEALNAGLALCTGAVIAVMIDGARMASPGLLAAGLHAARLHEKAVVFTQSLHLGPGYQWLTMREGYDQAEEDRLLASIAWPAEGYRLFDIAAGYRPDPSRWTSETPIESDALFMPVALWRELGGYEVAFISPGGGAASADLFRRACETPGSQLILVSGEATFHQLHQQSITSSGADTVDQIKRFSREYQRIRGPLTALKLTSWVFGVARPKDFRVTGPKGSHGVGRRYVDLLIQTLTNTHDSDRRTKLGAGADTRTERTRLQSLATQVGIVLEEKTPGDLMACGAGRGDAGALMAGMLASRDVSDRCVWVADSFERPRVPGLEDDGLDPGAARGSGLAVELKAVRDNFERFDLLTKKVRFIPGRSHDVLAETPVEALALLQLDSNLDSSPTEALEALYDRVSPSGFVVVDDYGAVPQCARAIDAFRALRGITEPLHRVDGSCVYWRKA